MSDRRIPPQVRRAWLFAVFLLVLTAVFPGLSASAGTPPHPQGAKPTIVLVHGAWLDGSMWREVTWRLQRGGYQVLVPALALRSLSSDAASLAAVLQQRTDGPVVLVGASYGGAVTTNAALADPDVRALVYVSAEVPDAGETVQSLVNVPGSHLAGDPARIFDFVSYPDAPAGDVDLHVKPSLFLDAFANDLPRRTADVLAVSQRPLTLRAATEPSGPPAWRSLPSWYLICTEDNVLPPAQQRAMAQRAGSTTVEVAAGHLPTLSQPDAVTDLIESAARKVS